MEANEPDFLLPPFFRKLWVSKDAREIWEKKFVQFAECWRQIEWLTVVHGVRPCAMLSLTQQELASLALILREFGLRAVVLLARLQTESDRKVLLFRVVIGRAGDLRSFRRAWKAGNDDTIGQLLGYPACCRSFYHQVFVQECLTDCVWQMAIRTVENKRGSLSIDVSGPPELNPFWIRAGMRMVPNFPCRFDCHEASALAKKFIAVGNKAGYGVTLEAALEILRWPVEWSSLHGIAEIKTPILKMSQRTDVTMQKYSIHRLGESFPKEGAKALDLRFTSLHLLPNSLKLQQQVII